MKSKMKANRPLNERQLEAFRAVMLTGSMTGAGRLLSVSQPAVTRLVKDLESELKLILFSREGTHIAPTAEGKALYREVERHFVSTERIREAAYGIREYNAGQIKVAAIVSLSMACLPKAIQRFAEIYPNIVISVHSGASHDIIDLVSNGSMDVGFVALPPGRNDLRSEPLSASKAICLLPKGHRLEKLAVITPKDVDGEDFVALGPGSLMRLELNARLHLAGAKPKIRIETLFSFSVATYVSRGFGVAVVDPLAASFVDPELVSVRAFSPAIPYLLSTVFPPAEAPSAPLEDFVNIMRVAYEQELAKAEELCRFGR